MPFPWTRNPLAAELLLLRLKRLARPVAEELRRASIRPSLVRQVERAAALPGADKVEVSEIKLAQLLRHLDESEPYPLLIEASMVKMPSGVEPFVFTLGHHDPAMVVVMLVDAMMGARGECGCGGAIEVPPGAVSHAWWEPPSEEGFPWTPKIDRWDSAAARGFELIWNGDEKNLPLSIVTLGREAATRIAAALEKSTKPASPRAPAWSPNARG